VIFVGRSGLGDAVAAVIVPHRLGRPESRDAVQQPKSLLLQPGHIVRGLPELLEGQRDVAGHVVLTRPVGLRLAVVVQARQRCHDRVQQAVVRHVVVDPAALRLIAARRPAASDAGIDRGAVLPVGAVAQHRLGDLGVEGQEHRKLPRLDV